MLKRFVGAVAQDIVLDLLGIYLAVGAVQGYNLVAGGLDSAGLVRFDVRSLRCKHALMWAEGCCNDGHVSLRTADKKVNIRVGIRLFFSYNLTGFFTVGIAAVACGLLKIRAHEAVHYLRQTVDSSSSSARE